MIATKRFGGVLLAAALLSSCAGSPGQGGSSAPNTSDPKAAPALPGEAPDVWAKRISDSYDTRKLLPKMNARPPKAIAEVMKAWDPALKKSLGKAADGSGYAFELMSVVQRLDAIWKNDELDQTAMGTIGNRIAKFPAADVSRWKTALAAIQKDDISELWTVVLLSRTDTLFSGPNGTLDSSAAMRTMDRLKNIPASAVTDLSTTLDAAKADVALRIAENDRFFDDASAVRQSELDKGVAAVKSIRPAAK